MDDIPSVPPSTKTEEQPPINEQPGVQNPMSTQAQAQPAKADIEANVPVTQNVNQEQNNSSVISYTKKRSLIDYFIYAVLILALLIWAVVGVLYFQNRKAKNQEIKETTQEITALPSPTPTQKIYNISIKNGNIVNSDSQGNEEILVKKEDFAADVGIVGFSKVNVSPDKKDICFESWSPAPKPALFLSAITGVNPYLVGYNKKNCVWSEDSLLIAYNDIKSAKEGTDLYVFNLENKSEILLTPHTATESAKPKNHIPVRWSENNKKLICKYSFVSAPTKEYNCEVDVETKFVNYL
jgi:hypothetical protein